MALANVQIEFGASSGVSVAGSTACRCCPAFGRYDVVCQPGDKFVWVAA